MLVSWSGKHDAATDGLSRVMEDAIQGKHICKHSVTWILHATAVKLVLIGCNMLTESENQTQLIPSGITVLVYNRCHENSLNPTIKSEKELSSGLS